MRLFLLVLFLFIAKVNAYSQTETVDDWLESFSVGMFDFEDGKSDKGADTLKLRTKYFYGSVLRAFSQAVPELADLTKKTNLLLVVTSNEMPRSSLLETKKSLLSDLENEGLSEWMSADAAQGEMTLYAVEKEGEISAFVFMILSDANTLTLIDFDGKVHTDVLMKLMTTDPGKLDQLMDFGNLDFDID